MWTYTTDSMDFVTVSTGLILPYWMGLPIRYIQEADGLCRTVQGKGSFVLGVNPGLVHEQRVVEIQKDLEKVLDKAKSYDLSKDEIRDLFDILMEE